MSKNYHSRNVKSVARDLKTFKNGSYYLNKLLMSRVNTLISEVKDIGRAKCVPFSGTDVLSQLIPLGSVLVRIERSNCYS